MKKKAIKKLSSLTRRRITALTIFFIGNLIFFLTKWMLFKYNDIHIDQVLFQIKSPAVGTNKNIMNSAYIRIGLFSVVLTLIEVLLHFLLCGDIKPLKKKPLYEKYSLSSVTSFFKNSVVPFSLAMLIFSLSFFVIKLKLVEYFKIATTESDFIKTHYVAPTDDVLTFPEEKRNLIYIYLESMETTLTSSSDGGGQINNYIPELTQLAKDNISFSNTDRLGGALPFAGTTWTAAAMFAQTSGMIIKVPINANYYGGENSFVPGISTLGEVLERHGYEQTLLIGSDARFAARDSYFTDHGHYNIVDTQSLKDEGRLDPDYHEFWGFEDAKLFDYAKEELQKLYETGKPFNFTMLTVDTHFPDGYVCDYCPDTYDQQYANVYACSSAMVYEFIEWIKTQPYYENTTVILSGDHLSMDSNFFDYINPEYQRTTYNCFINSAVEPIRTKQRQFGTFDMFPTTLAAMGVKINGNRLGLGTDLFSNSDTLTEIYGFENLDGELQKKSTFYNEKFLNIE